MRNGVDPAVTTPKILESACGAAESPVRGDEGGTEVVREELEEGDDAVGAV